MKVIDKIVIIDTKDDLKNELQDVLQQWNDCETEILWMSEMEKEKIADAACVILSADVVEDIKSLMGELKKLSIDKIVLMTNKLNHPMAHSAAVLGADIYYRYAGITSLIYKIWGSYKPRKEVPERIPLDQIKKENQGRIIAVHSPKGGTGKTTTSINLAIQYARKGLKVLLMDMAVFGNIGVQLKIVHRGIGLSGIISVLEQTVESAEEENIKALIGERIYKYSNEDIYLDVFIAAPPLKMEKMNGKNIEIIINALRDMDYDVIIVDTSSELTERNLTILELVDHILFVVSADLGSGWNMIQYKDILRSVGIREKYGLVVNGFTKYVGFSPKELEAELAIPLWCIIPECKEMQLLANQRQPISLQKKHWINPFYKRIAHYIIPIFTKKEMNINRWNFFKLFT